MHDALHWLDWIICFYTNLYTKSMLQSIEEAREKILTSTSRPDQTMDQESFLFDYRRCTSNNAEAGCSIERKPCGKWLEANKRATPPETASLLI